MLLIMATFKTRASIKPTRIVGTKYKVGIHLSLGVNDWFYASVCIYNESGEVVNTNESAYTTPIYGLEQSLTGYNISHCRKLVAQNKAKIQDVCLTWLQKNSLV